MYMTQLLGATVFWHHNLCLGSCQSTQHQVSENITAFFKSWSTSCLQGKEKVEILIQRTWTPWVLSSCIRVTWHNGITKLPYIHVSSKQRSGYFLGSLHCPNSILVQKYLGWNALVPFKIWNPQWKWFLVPRGSTQTSPLRYPEISKLLRSWDHPTQNYPLNYSLFTVLIEKYHMNHSLIHPNWLRRWIVHQQYHQENSPS